MKKSNLKKKDSYIFYNFIVRIISFLSHLYFGEKVIGKENIFKDGGCILAGNHEGYFDVCLLFRSTKRPIHFLGKKELFEGKLRYFFKKLHIIPVDRKNKNPEAIKKALEVLQEDKVIGIFPESTFHKTDLLLPFKPGAVIFSLESGKPIIPFAIYGKYKFRSHPIIKFGKPIYMKDVKEEDKVKYFENVIRSMLIEMAKEKDLKK